MMLHKSGVTQSLARFIAATQWDDIPAPVRHQHPRQRDSGAHPLGDLALNKPEVNRR
jgi:hypothetical protein